VLNRKKIAGNVGHFQNLLTHSKDKYAVQKKRNRSTLARLLVCVIEGIFIGRIRRQRVG